MGERKPMVVEGYTVPTEIEDYAVAWLRSATVFKNHELVGLLIRRGVPPSSAAGGYSPAYRIADRLLQRERKARNIRFGGGKWHRRKEPPPLAVPASDERGRP